MPFAMRPLVVALLVVCAGANAQPAVPLQVVARWTLMARDLPYAGPLPATHRLSLELFAFRDTAWEPAQIIDALRLAALILAQCGVHLDRAELHQLDGGEPELRDLFTPASRTLVRRLQPVKPAVFFVRDTRHQPAFDGEAFGHGNTRTRPELAGTVWLTASIRGLPIALAHELVHVLADSGAHSPEPGNLMHEDPEHIELSPAQCQRAVENGAANAWLQPAARPE